MSGDEEIVVVCMPASAKAYFDDDGYGRCRRCDVPVRFRPNVPAGSAKICVGCFRREVADPRSPYHRDRLGEDC